MKTTGYAASAGITRGKIAAVTAHESAAAALSGVKLMLCTEAMRVQCVAADGMSTRYEQTYVPLIKQVQSLGIAQAALGALSHMRLHLRCSLSHAPAESERCAHLLLNPLRQENGYAS